MSNTESEQAVVESSKDSLDSTAGDKKKEEGMWNSDTKRKKDFKYNYTEVVMKFAVIDWNIGK